MALRPPPASSTCHGECQRRRRRPLRRSSGSGTARAPHHPLLAAALHLWAATGSPAAAQRRDARGVSPPTARRISPAFVAQPTHSSRHPHWHDRRRSGGSAARAHANASRRQDAARRDDNAVRADDNDDDAAAGSDGRRRARLNGRLPILSRTVPLGIPVPPSLSEEDVSPDATKDDELSVTIWEVEEPASAIELWWSSGEADRDRMGDPFGVVMWPGSVLAAREMHARRLDDLVDKTVLVLGAGTGLEAQAAALLGARRVVATDINALSLRLLEHGVQEAGLGEVVECRVLDLFGPDPLPVEGVDLVLVADVLYNQELGMQVGKRIMELLNIPEERRPGIIVTDSQRFHGTDFTPLLNSELERVGRPLVEWEERDMVVTTSGILIEEDQTYNVTARIISV